VSKLKLYTNGGVVVVVVVVVEVVVEVVGCCCGVGCRVVVSDADVDSVVPLDVSETKAFFSSKIIL
jgi:hypothetical protein